MRYFPAIILCVAFLSPCDLFSQYDDLLRNPRISWVAEYTADFELNPVYNDNLGDEYNLLNVVRLENTGAVNGLYEETELSWWTSAFMLKGLRDNAFKCFADEQLSQAVSREQMQRLLNRPDTVAGFDHPGDIAIVLNEVRAEEIVLFRARQVMYYDASTRVLGARLLALAPVVAETDSEGNTIGYQPLVWIKTPALTGKAAKKIAKEATYAVQTRMKENAPVMDQLRPVKGSFDPQRWSYGEVTRPSHRNLSYDGFEALNAADLQKSVFTNDTIVRYNDEGETEIERIVPVDATQRVERIRLVQNWYIDERRGLLDCRVVAVAPLAAVRDSEGNFRYYRPLFYVKY